MAGIPRHICCQQRIQAPLELQRILTPGRHTAACKGVQASCVERRRRRQRQRVQRLGELLDACRCLLAAITMRGAPERAGSCRLQAGRRSSVAQGVRLALRRGRSSGLDGCHRRMSTVVGC